MNTTEAIELLRGMGLEVTRRSFQNYRKGYWKDKDGNQHWYFPDHTRLPSEQGGSGFGYTYSEAGVKAWGSMMIQKILEGKDVLDTATI